MKVCPFTETIKPKSSLRFYTEVVVQFFITLILIMSFGIIGYLLGSAFAIGRKGFIVGYKFFE